MWFVFVFFSISYKFYIIFNVTIFQMLFWILMFIYVHRN